MIATPSDRLVIWYYQRLEHPITAMDSDVAHNSSIALARENGGRSMQ